MKTRVLYLYLLSVFLMWLTACQKEDALDVALFSEEPIRFDVPSILSGVEVRSLSRAPVDMFPTNGSFGVLGYCLANYDGSSITGQRATIPDNNNGGMSRRIIFIPFWLTIRTAIHTIP